jgi:hypothetical protein
MSDKSLTGEHAARVRDTIAQIRAATYGDNGLRLQMEYIADLLTAQQAALETLTLRFDHLHGSLTYWRNCHSITADALESADARCAVFEGALREIVIRDVMRKVDNPYAERYAAIAEAALAEECSQTLKEGDADGESRGMDYDAVCPKHGRVGTVICRECQREKLEDSSSQTPKEGDGAGGA